MSEDTNKKPEENIRIANYASKKGEVVLREHEFDGIQEYDQQLPNWWLLCFWGGIACFVAYWIFFYAFGFMASSTDEMDERVANIHKQREEVLEAMMAKLDDNLLVNDWSHNTSITSAGQATYQANCVACHSQDLSATNASGLPLNDGTWKYGNKPMDIFKIINEGTPKDSDGHNGAKMVAWGKDLSPKQVAELTAFLISKNRADFKDLEE